MMRRAGDIVRIEVEKLNPDFPGVVVLAKHVGPRLAREWRFAIQRINVQERERMRSIPPDDLARDDDGQVRQYQTIDGFEAIAKFALQMVEQSVIGVEGLGYDVPKDTVAEELDRLDLCSVLMAPLLSAQELKEPEVF